MTCEPLPRPSMVSQGLVIGIVVGLAALMLVVVAWLTGRSPARDRARAPAAPLVDEQATWTPAGLGPPVPGRGVYVRAIEGLAALCLGELEVERVQEHWEADPTGGAELGRPVLVEAKVDGTWHQLEPRYLGHRLDIDTLVDELNQLLPEDGPRLAILHRDPPTVALARWTTEGSLGAR